jgi:hypothetical protein
MRMTTAACSLALTLAFGACGGDDGGAVRPAELDPSAATSSGPVSRWLAVVDVAPRADDLDAATERLREPLGAALVVSPVSCFDGLPTDAGDGYLIGAVGESRNEVERLVAAAGDRVMFSASVTILCTD